MDILRIVKSFNEETREKMHDPKKDSIELPMCYGNYCQKDISCQKCFAKKDCRKIPLPKEPEWCNPE